MPEKCFQLYWDNGTLVSFKHKNNENIIKRKPFYLLEWILFSGKSSAPSGFGRELLSKVIYSRTVPGEEEKQGEKTSGYA